jgi:hypothetical protein
MSSEHPAVNGNGYDPASDSEPEPVNKWDLQAMESLLQTMVTKQAVQEAQMVELERHVQTLRKIVENAINVQLQDHQTTHRKLDLIVEKMLRE